MNFPSLTRTKAEAQQLAANFFPGEAAAMAKLKPGTTHPRYQLTHDTADTLRSLFFWLHEQKPKIYKRARWTLFYDLASRVAYQLDENAQAKVRELYAEDRMAKAPRGADHDRRRSGYLAQAAHSLSSHRRFLVRPNGL